MVRQEATTMLLLDAEKGDRKAIDTLVPHVYEELKRIAHRRLRYERDDHTLNTTALVHEAFLKLVNAEEVGWRTRSHFVAIASTAMRQILVDYARQRGRQRRGGGQGRITMLDDLMPGTSPDWDTLMDLDEALIKLEAQDPRMAKVVEYRFFGGMTYDEIAQFMGLSKRTAERLWNRARVHLLAFIEQDVS